MPAIYPDTSAAPVMFEGAHADLYVLYDIDVVILTVEIYAEDLPLPRAQDTLFRFGRGYPTYWEPEGRGGHCPKYEVCGMAVSRWQRLAVSDSECHLMPLMAYVVVDDPGALTRAGFVRLGLAASPGTPGALPYSERHHLSDFEERYCYDRCWNGQDRARPGTRFMCSGRVFAMVGDCRHRIFVDRKTDLEQFRHEYFLLFLIAHFHRAAGGKRWYA